MTHQVRPRDALSVARTPGAPPLRRGTGVNLSGDYIEATALRGLCERVPGIGTIANNLTIRVLRVPYRDLSWRGGHLNAVAECDAALSLPPDRVVGRVIHLRTPVHLSVTGMPELHAQPMQPNELIDLLRRT